MSAWQEGRTYSYYGTPIACRRRWFEGALELVELVYAVTADERPAAIVRTAAAIAPCVVPRVTDTLGGVYRADMCEHRQNLNGEPRRVIANAGPFAGRECCALCGGALDMTANELAALGLDTL